MTLRHLEVQRESVNLEQLTDEIQGVIAPDDLVGLSARPGRVVIHLRESVKPEQIAQVRTLAAAHDSTQLSARQQAAIQRQVRLRLMRQTHTSPSDPAIYATETPLIRQMAQRLAWLEEEIRDLRGLPADGSVTSLTEEGA